MADTKPKTTRRRKLTAEEAMEGVKAIMAENAFLQSRVDALTEVVKRAEAARDKAQHDYTIMRHARDEAASELHRLRTQAAQVKTWAGRHAHGNNVLIHAIDAVLFKPGYGEVHPFARWGHPPLV